MNCKKQLFSLKKEMYRHEVLDSFESYSLRMINELITKAVIYGYTEFVIERNEQIKVRPIDLGFELIRFEVKILAKKKNE